MTARGETGPRDFGRRFEAVLAELTAARPPERWLVAFSGGLDSTVLLHALRRARPDAELTAIHIDHGLHPDSAAWSAHCSRVAATLGVESRTRRVDITPGSAQSLEAIARDARYAALASETGPGDLLVTAHHADDQLETILLRVLRGTGVRGLTAIHGSMPCGRGTLARPFLGFTRSEIRAEAERLGLEWLEDPSNLDLRFDRNFLRAECLPRLLERWPRAGIVADRLARHMAEAEAVLGEVADADLAAAVDPARIPVEVLSGLSEPRLNNAIRHAIRRLALPVPDASQLAEIRQALASRPDAVTQVSWPGAEARLYRRHLYLLAPPEQATPSPGRLSPDQALRLEPGELRLVAAEAYGIPDRWARAGLDVRFREGGERFRPHHSRHHKSLKQWFQEAGVVPWMRAAVPLVCHGDRIVAVADLCLADALPATPDDAPFWRPVWTGHPPLH